MTPFIEEKSVYCICPEPLADILEILDTKNSLRDRR